MKNSNQTAPSNPALTKQQFTYPATNTLQVIVSGFARHWYVICTSVIVSAALGATFTHFAVPTFEAAAFLRYEAQRVDLPQLVEMIASDKTISTEIEVLKGRAPAVAVIDSLGLRARVIKPQTARNSKIFTSIRVASSFDSATWIFRKKHDGNFDIILPKSGKSVGIALMAQPNHINGVAFEFSRSGVIPDEFVVRIDALDESLSAFAASVKVSAPARDADLIAIRAESTDPERAAAIANLLAENVIVDRRSVSGNRTAAAMVFLQQQSDSLGRELRTTEDSLRSYQQREHVVDAPQQATAEVTRLAKLQADLAGVRAERNAFASLVSELNLGSSNGAGDRSVSRRLMAFPALLGNASAAVLLGSLAQAETERSQLLIRRMPADSDVQVLTRRIRDIDGQLQGIAESYLQSLSNQVTSLESEASAFRTQLDILPEKELQTARLQRNGKVLNDLWVLVETRLKEAQVTGAVNDPSVRIVDSAVAPTKPISPRPLINLALSVVFGAAVGVAATMASIARDHSVRSRNDAHAASGIPVLGALPRMPRVKPAAQRLLGEPPSGSTTRSKTAFGSDRSKAAAEIRSRLITNLDAPIGYAESMNQVFAALALRYAKPIKVIAFTSALAGEGKTISAINFALLGASRGLRILLIDADLRCGVVGPVLDIGHTPGLAELLNAEVSVEQAIHCLSINKQASLSVIASGRLPATPGSFLTLDKIKQFFGSISREYDLIIVDTPPVNLLADAGLLGSAADAVLVVVRAGHTKSEDLRYAMDQLVMMRAPVIGTLLNDIDLRRNAIDDGSYRYLEEVNRYHLSIT